jgi:hypothetical protein
MLLLNECILMLFMLLIDSIRKLLDAPMYRHKPDVVSVQRVCVILEVEFLRGVTPCNVARYQLFRGLLKMEAAWTSETSAFYFNITRCYTSEKLDLILHPRENFKSR